MSIDLKSRMVSFRLTAEEYERIRDICFSQGLASVSEMARTALQSVINNPTALPIQSLEGRIAELEGRVKILAGDVRRLQARPKG